MEDFSFLSSTVKNDFLGPTAFMRSRIAFSVIPWDMGCADAKILHLSCLRLQSPLARTLARNTGFFFFNSFFSCLAGSSYLFLWRAVLCCRNGLLYTRFRVLFLSTTFFPDRPFLSNSLSFCLIRSFFPLPLRSVTFWGTTLVESCLQSILQRDDLQSDVIQIPDSSSTFFCLPHFLFFHSFFSPV